MGVFINRVERSELTAGDHIYSWRTLFAYSHHGIHVGGSKVVHFEQKNTVSVEPVLFSTPFKCSSASSTNVSTSSKNVSASSTNVSSTCQIPDCGYEQKESGVILSCLDCFLDGGRLYRYEYGVSNSFFHSRIRGGTCTTAQSDPPEEVIHRAMYLLKNGYGDYDLVKNNCEDFALYCKTGLLVLDQGALGSSGQANSVRGKEMGLLTHRVERSEIASGDHIYTWRTVFAYSHHGIYVGGSKVVHFTREQNIISGDPILFSVPLTCSSASSTNVPSTCTNIPDCGFHQKESGVVLSCLDCFLGDGLLYRFDYGASPSVFLTKLRGGTCTTAQSDPPEAVIHRAMFLLQNGFGNYDVFKNNCEDFALYCKTGLLGLDQGALGRSGQAASVIGAPLAAIASSSLKLFMTSPAGLVVATAGMYCLTRYATDIGVRTDVTKVKVEELTSFHNCKTSKKRINEATLNQTDTPAKKRQTCD